MKKNKEYYWFFLLNKYLYFFKLNIFANKIVVF